jgi:hypothetical protein
VAALHSRARRDPFVGRIEPRLEIVIGDDAGRRVMSHANDLHATQGHLRLTGRLVLYLDGLPAVIRAAACAGKVRPLGLMALRTLDGRYRAELPVRRPAATRLAARRLPF